MRRRSIWLIICILLVWNIVLSVLLYNVSNREVSTTQTNTTIINNEVNGFSTDLTNITETVQSSIAYIETDTTSGTGVIIRQDENIVYIATSYHVVENAQVISVALDNYDEYFATLVGQDTIRDVAILSIEVDYSVTPIVMGDSALVKDGEFVLAIGSPSSIENRTTLAFGIISSSDRTLDLDINGVNYFINMLQSDVNLSSGYSGGPLVNMAGELIGLNTLVAQDDNITYSITSCELEHIANSIIGTGISTKRDLGIKTVAIKDMANYQKSRLGINLNQTSGLYVSEVKSDFIGSALDLRVGDIILSINEISMHSLEDLIDQEYLSHEQIVIEVLRGEETLILETTFEISSND